MQITAAFIDTDKKFVNFLMLSAGDMRRLMAGMFIKA
jgi:hypothetical protein